MKKCREDIMRTLGTEKSLNIDNTTKIKQKLAEIDLSIQKFDTYKRNMGTSTKLLSFYV